MQAESVPISVSFMQDGAGFAVGTVLGKCGSLYNVNFQDKIAWKSFHFFHQMGIFWQNLSTNICISRYARKVKIYVTALHGIL